MRAKVEKIVEQCRTCKLNKYDRHPCKHAMQCTLIPEYAGHIVQIDIYHTNKQLIIIAIDKFSKYALIKLIKSRATEDLKQPLRDDIISLGIPKVIIFDSEKSFNYILITLMLTNQFNVEIHKIPPYKSCSNGQVERFHSTLTEIIRCLKSENTHESFVELLDK